MHMEGGLPHPNDSVAGGRGVVTEESTTQDKTLVFFYLLTEFF